MPPTNETHDTQAAPRTGVEWNRVTWYSKLLAVILFIGLVCGAFYFGMWYQQQRALLDIATTPAPTQPVTDSTTATTTQPTATSTESVAKDGILEIPCDHTDTVIPIGASPIVPKSEYLKDGTSVYLLRQDEGHVVAGADPKTFRVLPDIDEYGMDSVHVYYAGCVLPNANPATFKHLANGTYGTDGVHVYWRWMMLTDVDAKTFVSMPRGYGKDNTLVYWENEKVLGADPVTFLSFEDKSACNGSCTITAQDKNHTYMLNQVVQ